MPKDAPADPPEDIPAWFMTYSDVITLLMTFFILLLTFATTEPERFEKVTVSVFGRAGATGVAGHKHDKLDRDSWTTRIRPRAARIALQGSEMPPIEKEMASAAVGKGLEGLSEEESKRDVMKTFAFELPIKKMVGSDMKVNRQGAQAAAKLSAQLRSLSIHCVLEVSDPKLQDRVCAFADYLYHVEKARPGQIGTALTEKVTTDMVRIVIEQYESGR
ncbi:flagellar motor protein MotB [Roseiconus lacunae]|uniref:Flagellar motor protein MotB n=1 Tax=Roseiconus lacunae TaxID=2605694 RepID=A0ABT7PE68_9BACT|nr:flagellar motor protein MotB [Roseiconus lacunae]MDM4014521.1 flagellar motor protein MotB [Roseiconus lacunae]